MTPHTTSHDTWMLPAAEWQALRQAARELDLVYAGYYRLRPTSIAVYCGPHSHPEGWDLPFTDGSPDLPRQYVGEFEAEPGPGDEQVTVRLLVANWAAVQAVKAAYDQGRYRGRFQEFVRDQEIALRGRPEDRVWLREQLRRLRQHVQGALLID
ncbi:MAG: hypothetical protein HY320_01380 [Armatimonadetes bacterium]|nr:hypothetical protein [Armatimonadota bacterium]